VLFENDWVRLVRVRYPANSSVPLHGLALVATTTRAGGSSA